MINKSIILFISFISSIFFNSLYAEDIKTQLIINQTTPQEKLQTQSHQQAIWIKQQQQLIRQRLDFVIKNIPMLSLEKL